MLTDQQILDLIARPKMIVQKEPARGYREENRQRRCDLELQANDDNALRFTVFVRHSSEFIENYSIGLRYQTSESRLGTITLVRYNGPHGETSRHPDGHYAMPHIHRITESELMSGSTQPQERHREVTDRYATFEQALSVFFADAGIANLQGYFPGIIPGAVQGSLLDGHR